MDPTNPQEQEITPSDVQSQETLDKSNVQKRIDELTAARYAELKRNEELQAQLAQTTAALAARLAAENEKAKVAAPVEQLPEDATPAQVAKFMSEKMERMQREAEMRTQQMYWAMQNQLDQQQVAQKFAHLPDPVRLDAANRLTALKQRYGDAVNMEDAVAIAFYKHTMAQQSRGQQNAYNQMPQPLSNHGSAQFGGNDGGSGSTALASPAARPDWDNLDINTQNRLISEWEKKGGRLIS